MNDLEETILLFLGIVAMVGMLAGGATALGIQKLFSTYTVRIEKIEQASK